MIFNKNIFESDLRNTNESMKMNNEIKLIKDEIDLLDKYYYNCKEEIEKFLE